MLGVNDSEVLCPRFLCLQLKNVIGPGCGGMCLKSQLLEAQELLEPRNLGPVWETVRLFLKK